MGMEGRTGYEMLTKERLVEIEARFSGPHACGDESSACADAVRELVRYARSARRTLRAVLVTVNEGDDIDVSLYTELHSLLGMTYREARDLK